MGTNFYARILPTEPKKQHIKNLIDENDFESIISEVEDIYGRFEPTKNEDIIHGVIHLGKRSAGWKFIWNPNIYIIKNGHLEKTPYEGGYSVKYIPDPDTLFNVYPLTKKGIKEFIDRDDVEVYDEYGKKQDKDEFFKMTLDCTKWNGEESWDSDSYNKAHPDEHKFNLRNRYTDYLESLGYKLSKYKEDFYSDGLRFLTSTDFS